jgi:hypothetical protein
LLCIIVFVSGSALVWDVELGCQRNGLGVEDPEGAESDVSHEEILIKFGFRDFPGPNIFVAAAGLRGNGGCFSSS